MCILLLDLEIIVFTGTDICWAPPYILESIRTALAIQVFETYLRSLYQSLQLIFAESLLSRALLVAVDLWITGIARIMPTVVAIGLICGTLKWALMR